MASAAEIKKMERKIEKEMKKEKREMKREGWDFIPDEDLYALDAMAEGTQKRGKKAPKCHPQDKECVISGGAPGNTLTLPQLLRLRIILSNKRRELLTLRRAVKNYDSRIRAAGTTKKRSEIRDAFINKNKIVPELASLKIEEDLPKTEERLAKVNKILERSAKDLAINPPSSSDLLSQLPQVPQASAVPQAPKAPASAAPTRKRPADLRTTTQTRKRPRQHSSQASAALQAPQASAAPQAQPQAQASSDDEDYSDVPSRASATIQAAKGKGILENIKGTATATLQRIGILGGKRTRRAHKTRKAHKTRRARKTCKTRRARNTCVTRKRK